MIESYENKTSVVEEILREEQWVDQFFIELCFNKNIAAFEATQLETNFHVEQIKV